MRNKNFDILKSIALICIILAHVKPNGYIRQLRSFDVILMILVSVLISIKSIEKKGFNYKSYLIKRVKRLIVPTWIFLVFYFLVFYIIKGQIDYKSIILSFSLISGIGYVWIIRIYIYVAIVTPIINKIYNKVSKIQYILFNIGAFAIYSILLNFDNNLGNKYIDIIYRASILDFIGYSLVVAFVIGIKESNKESIINIIIILTALFIILFIKNDFRTTLAFKYPLQLYFVLYSLIISLILKLILEQYDIIRYKFIANGANYLSKNSMGIYLWHILFISLVSNVFEKSNSLFRCFILLMISIIFDYFTQKLKATFKNKFLNTSNKKINFT